MRTGRGVVGLALLSVILLLFAAGCGKDSNSFGPGSGADIRGYISSVLPVSPHETVRDLAGTVFISGEVEADTNLDSAYLAVTPETRVFRVVDDSREEIDFSGLRAGQLAEARFTGPVMMSYPAQAVADEITVLAETGIEPVLEMHRAGLMAIPGVVGTGVSARDGQPVIVVFLQSDSPEIRNAVPGELDGFHVITEVTGFVEALRVPE